MITDKIWYEDLSVLIRRPREFFPSRHMSTPEQTNALVRLIIYVVAALYFYNRSMRTVWIGIGLIVALSLVYRGRGGKYAGLSNLAPGACRQSTPDNPFANTLVTEYGKPLPPPPCSYDEMHADAEKNFDLGLYKNIEDWGDRENSQRQFFTMPNGGVPIDYTSFAEFLYGDVKNCKTDPKQCV